MFFSLCHTGGDVDRETMIAKCVRDRNELLSRFTARYPGSGRLRPADIVRDIIRDVCDYGIEERPLPKGQSAHCDFRTRRIKLNSRAGSFVKGGPEQILSWQRCILAHELGHVRLHTDEVEEQVFISSHGAANGFDDPRFFQKENEANLYAAVFMVPSELLLKCKRATTLREQYLNATEEVTSQELWDFVAELSQIFGVTVELMRYSLELYGWIRFLPARPRARTGKLELVRERD